MASSCVIDVLIPTYNRACALAVVLVALSAQNVRNFRIIISDQSDHQSVFEKAEVEAVLRILEATGRDVVMYRHLPRRGLAEQRTFLLAKATASYCLFLDDDVVLETDTIERLYQVIRKQQCGFVGSALHGLSFIDDIRLHQQHIEFWDSQVTAESVIPDSAAWDRHHLHSAANLFHLQNRMCLRCDNERLYRVAWIGGCVLFDTKKLRSVGGFNFWPELPADHCGEDAVAQLRVMERFGGCGIIPSGAYHMELPTTVPRREIDAPKIFFDNRSTK
ncbi:MAG: glycosyltransferase family A protein [Pseudomonadota bacterium]